jgi:hypothetical protein
LERVQARSDGWQESPPLGRQQKAQGADDRHLETSRKSARALVINQKAGCYDFKAEADGVPLSCA